MLFRHSISIAYQLKHIYNSTVHENKSYVALKVGKSVGTLRQQHTTRCIDV